MSKNKATMDVETYTKKADELAEKIISTVGATSHQTKIEDLLIIALAVGRVLQTICTNIGANQKDVIKDFCAALTDYFEMGGPQIMTELLNKMRQNSN